MAVKKLRQVFIVAADFDAQCAFYQHVLGLELMFKDGAHWAQFKAGDVTFALAGERESLGAQSGQVVAVFEVTDLDAHVAEVRRGGGAHGAIREMGAHGRTVLCRDPNGAAFALLQK